ncbi:MAG: hypothetical protein GF307_03670 [candidate division Zixibacteria bacterium]|nr:hypothetical protein [candidate division Zixibacteria bacterium]
MKKLSVIIIILGLTFLFSAGCENKFTANNQDQLTEGNYSDSTYLISREVIDEVMVANMLETIGYAMDSIGGFTTGLYNVPSRHPHYSLTVVDPQLNYPGFPDFPKPYIDSVATGYDSTTGWWIYYQEGVVEDSEGDTLLVYLSDSIRYSTDGTFQRIPDSGTDKMEYKVTVGNEYYPPIVFDASFSQDMVYTGTDTETIALNGDGSYSYEFGSGQDILTRSLSETYSNVTINAGSQYPSRGVYTATINGYYSIGGNYQLLNISVDVAFYESYFRVRIENGNNYWQWQTNYGS